MTTEITDDHHVCDIIMSIPWRGTTWHLGNYWIDSSCETGYTYDAYSEGDHEEVEESELPSGEAYQAAWDEYYEYTAETGDDPLGEYFAIPRKYKQRQRWTLKIAEGIAGLYLRAARRGRGPWMVARDLPLPVAEFLCLTEWGTQNPRIKNKLDVPWKRIATMADECHEFKLTSKKMGVGRFTGVIEVEIPRKASAIQRDVKRKARRTLRKG